MIMIKKITILFILGVIISSSCSSTQLSGKKRKPKWVSQRPVNNEYYIGVSMAKKSGTDANYIQIAKNNALSDIISEISVTLASNSVLHQFEDNAGFKETYEAYTITIIKDELEAYELVDTWENKEEYWVYYRLSKATYKKIKREKLERAKNLSKDFFEKAREAQNKNDINNALIYYIKAFDAIKNHLDEDLSVFTLDGKILLGNEIYQSIQTIFSSLEIKGEKDLYELKALSANKELVKAKISYKGARLSNIPIIFSFPDLGIKNTEKAVSLNDGTVECSIANMAPKGRTQILKAALDIDAYFGENTKDDILKEMFVVRGSMPYGNLNIKVKELYAFVESEEISLGRISSRQNITNVFKEELSKNFFSFTQEREKADVIIKITSNAVKGNDLGKHNLFTAFIDCNISIRNAKTNAEVFSDGFSNLKGMKSGGFERAVESATSKAEQKIRKEIIPEIRKINL